MRDDFLTQDRYLKDQKNKQDADIFNQTIRIDRLEKRVFGEEKPILHIVNQSLNKTENHVNSHLSRFTEKQEETTFVVQQKHQDMQF